MALPLFSTVARVYGYTLKHMLDEMTLLEVILFYSEAKKYEESTFAMQGENALKAYRDTFSIQDKNSISKPDKKAFYERYGDKIKKPKP